MPDSGMIFLSFASLLVGVCLFLSPRLLLELSTRLNTSLVTLDEWLIRHRYVMGMLAFLAGYAFFKISLWLPSLR